MVKSQLLGACIHDYSIVQYTSTPAAWPGTTSSSIDRPEGRFRGYRLVYGLWGAVICRKEKGLFFSFICPARRHPRLPRTNCMVHQCCNNAMLAQPVTNQQSCETMVLPVRGFCPLKFMTDIPSRSKYHCHRGMKRATFFFSRPLVLFFFCWSQQAICGVRLHPQFVSFSFRGIPPLEKLNQIK